MNDDSHSAEIDVAGNSVRADNTVVVINTDGEVGRFPSLASLRSAHSDLLKRHRQGGDTAQVLADAEVLIRRGRATGALLDTEDGRWASQSLLDYWTTMLYRAGHEPPDSTLAEFDPMLAPELEDALCPYQGLDAFYERHYQVYFGRQRMMQSIVEQLEQSRLLAIVGPSGSGKSSLVLAGLLPSLKAGLLPGSQDWHYLPRMVPGSKPLTNLARLFRPDEVDAAEWDPQQVVEHLQGDSEYLSYLVSTLQAPTVLVIDQFEELFTLCLDEAVRRAFVDNLLGLIQSTDARHIAILTMRTDFEPYVARMPTLQPLFEAGLVRVTPLNATELREAIVGPADLVGLRFEEGVVDALLQDTLGEPAALPLLQFTLLKLWESRERNRVTWESYQRLGGGRLALAHSADEFYEALIPEEQVTARRILLRMVRPTEGLEVTSSRIRRESLYQAGEADYRIDQVLDKLVEARLVRLTRGESPADDQVEVAHEALVRNWPRLVDWLESERETMRRRLRLTTAAEHWQESGEDPSALWRGLLLEEASRYEDLNQLEGAFVEASRMAVEKAVREREASYKRELAQAQALAAEQERRAEAERQRAEVQAQASRRMRFLGVIALVQSGVYLIALVLLAIAVLGRSSGSSLSSSPIPWMAFTYCCPFPLALMAFFQALRSGVFRKSRESPAEE